MISNNVEFCLFVCFVALCPKSTAMVMTGRSVKSVDSNKP